MQNKLPSHHGVKEQVAGNYPNETIKLLIERASCRSFLDKKIPADVLQYILQSGTHAATGGNLQPYSIIKIEKQTTKKNLAKLCYQKFIANAPVNLIFCIDWHRLERWAKLEVAPFTATSAFRHFWISFQDTMIAAQNICTAADAMGLGSVYIGTVMEFFPTLKRMLKLPKGVMPVVLLCIGYPKTKLIPRKKLGVDAVVHNEKYSELSDKQLLDVFNEKYAGMKMEITKERLKRFEKVCRDVAGEKFAEKCNERIKKQGYFSRSQLYFGLHYAANEMPKKNEKLLKVIEQFGFNWFKKYESYKVK
jgi:FMN reductase [NAD(P)H]